jgi:hypothetical protein
MLEAKKAIWVSASLQEKFKKLVHKRKEEMNKVAEKIIEKYVKNNSK